MADGDTNSDLYESQTRQTLRAAGIGLFSYKMDGTINSIDDVVLRQLDLYEFFEDSDEIKGREINELIISSTPENFVGRKSEQQKRIRDKQLKIRTLNGNDKWFLHDSDLGVDAKTGEELVYATLRVISKLKIAENLLRESEIRYRSLFESSPYAVLLIDLLSKSVIDANKVAHEMMTLSFNKLFTAGLSELFSGDITEMIDSIASGDSLFLETAKLSKGYIFPGTGEEIPVEIHGQLLRFDDGKYVQLTIRDIHNSEKILLAKDKMITDLQKSLNDIKKRDELIPICSPCKKIRDGENNWITLENYVLKKLKMEFTHTLCPACAAKLYPQYFDTMYPDKDK